MPLSDIIVINVGKDSSAVFLDTLHVILGKHDSFSSLVVRFFVWSRLFIFHAIKNLHTPCSSFCCWWKGCHGGSKIRFRRFATRFRHIARLTSELNVKTGSGINENLFFCEPLGNRILLGHSLYLTVLRSGKKRLWTSTDKLIDFCFSFFLLAVPFFLISLAYWRLRDLINSVMDCEQNNLNKFLGISLYQKNDSGWREPDDYQDSNFVAKATSQDRNIHWLANTPMLSLDSEPKGSNACM